MRYGLAERYTETGEDGDIGAEIDHAQRVIEGQHLDVRQFLWKYETMIEQQRRIIHSKRREILLDNFQSLIEEELPDLHAQLLDAVGEDSLRNLERHVILARIDQWWARYLKEISEIKEDVALVSMSRVPLHEFQRRIASLFDELLQHIDNGVINTFRAIDPATISADPPALPATGATWTYQASDHIFPDLMTRLGAGLKRLIAEELNN